ncbi:DegV family protein, partial [Cellulomonas shaoxiangyii]
DEVRARRRASGGLPRRRRPPAPVWPDLAEVAAAAAVTAASTRTWFLVESLEHLRRGGRLSAPAAALGTVLGLRPLLAVQDGRVVVADKVRTRRAARERLEHVAATELAGRGAVRIGVHHAGDPGAAHELAARLAERADDAVEVVVAGAGAVLGAHAGPGLLAVVVADA